MEQPESVTLTVYMQVDVAELARVLQMMVKQPMQIERFNANLVARDFSHVSGLEYVQEPVMRLAIVGTVGCSREVERATKALNRLVSVFKVIADPS